MDVPLLIAGLLGLVAAAVHGIGGQVIVVRKLFDEPLPSTSFGGPRMTQAMILAAWHITTVAFFAAGAGMIAAAAALDGEAAKAVAIFCAAAFTGFAGVVLWCGAARNRARALLQHPGPAVLSLTAALAWWGAV